MWVPEDWVADAMKGLPDTQVEIVNPVEFRSEADIPASVADVEFYVPPFLGSAAVASGRLRAAMDVTEPEPLSPGHPRWSLPGAFITPHVGASTPVSLRRAAELARRQAAAYLRGEALQNVITGSY